MAKDLTQSSYVVEGNTFQTPIIHYMCSGRDVTGCLCGLLITPKRLRNYGEVAQWLYNCNFRASTKSYPVNGAGDMDGNSYASIYSTNGNQIKVVILPFGANSLSTQDMPTTDFVIQILN